jgi:hypothetical protein
VSAAAFPGLSEFDRHDRDLMMICVFVILASAMTRW